MPSTTPTWLRLCPSSLRPAARPRGRGSRRWCRTAPANRRCRPDVILTSSNFRIGGNSTPLGTSRSTICRIQSANARHTCRSGSHAANISATCATSRGDRLQIQPVLAQAHPPYVVAVAFEQLVAYVLGRQFVQSGKADLLEPVAGDEGAQEMVAKIRRLQSHTRRAPRAPGQAAARPGPIGPTGQQVPA